MTVGGNSDLGRLIRSFEKTLASLALSYGVWRSSLPEFLGDQLCARFGLVTKSVPGGPPTDSTELIRAKVAWHLRRLVGSVTPDEVERQAARIAFNVTSHRELHGIKTIEDRVRWAIDHGLYTKSERTIRNYRTKINADIARELIRAQPMPSQGDLAAIIAEFSDVSIPAVESPSRHDPDADEAETLQATPIAQADAHPLWTFLGSRPRMGILSICAGAVVLVVLLVIAIPQFFSKPGGGAAVELQDALRVTPVELRTNHLWHLAFPADAQNIERFLAKAEFRPAKVNDPFSIEELDAGGYLAGPVDVRVEIENDGDRELTLYDVRLGQLKVEQVPMGAAILVGPIGGDPTDYLPRQMNFDLDEVPPIAMEQRSSNDRRNFFDQERIGLRPHQKQTLILSLDTDRAAYSFNIEFHFELSGQKYVQVLTRNGQPFRLAAHLCLPSPNPALKGAFYKAVRSNYPLPEDWGADGTKRLQLHSLDPASACKILSLEKPNA